jgi:uncharacterized damage-inducible protein DinB
MHRQFEEIDLMKNITALLAFLVLLISGGLAQAQDVQTVSTIPQVLNHNIAGVEGEVVPAADAMPEEKYAFVPSNGEFKGVRTFAEQVKHVAAVNYMVGAAILEEKPPVELGGENGPDAIKNKADIVKFLKDSFVYVHNALTSVNESNLLKPIKSPFGDGKTNRLALSTLIAAHCFDHYGQMVVYLRMNRIVPPASR